MTKAESERPVSAATQDDSSLATRHSSLIRHSGFLIPHSPDRLVVAAAVLLFAAVSLALNVLSRGFLEADGITHYLFARWAPIEPQYLTNVWGRPFVTLLHLMPAQLPGRLLEQPVSLVAVRAVSMLMAVGCGLVAWRIAAWQGSEHGHHRPALAALFTLCMPMVVLHSVSELTELPFAFLAICSVWAYQRRAWWLLAGVAGLLPLARPEGFGFGLLALTGLLLHRRWLPAALVILPVLLWDRAGWWINGQQQGNWWKLFSWLAANWPYSGESLYDPGPLWKLAWMLPAVVGPMIVPFVIIGLAVSLRGDDDEHKTRVTWIIAGVPLLVLIVHSLLHWLGKMSSSGDVRYLVTVAPFWALLAARGWDWLALRLCWRANYVLAALAGVVPLVAMHIGYRIVPVVPDPAAREAVAMARWFEQSDWRRTHPNMLTDHPLIWYTLDLNLRRHGGGKERVLVAPPGSLYLWQEMYSTLNSQAQFVVPPDLPPQHGWREVTPADFPPDWRVFVTEPEAAEPVNAPQPARRGSS